jgi:isoleucyl-tRNA synthetase
MDRDSLIVLADYVTTDAGTGCVHTAPGHGVDDYQTGLRYGLDILSPVNNEGIYTEEAGQYAGEQIPAVNGKIVDDLKASGMLIHHDAINHSYPHCWRCKKPVMYRATPQWFISMEINNLRQNALAEIKKVAWTPAWGMQRIYSMVEGRPDWCLSRQRSWGVPITVISCSKCGEIVRSEKLVQKIDELFLKEGADAWFRYDIETFLEKGATCSSCGSQEFTKEEDILDVWFDSGVSHAAVCEIRDELRAPADLYLEGSDQHRGWFQSALLTSVGTRNRAPFHGVLTHGYVVDGEGKKMSKSVGNVVAPGEVIEKYGAEILRLWVSSEDYRDDVKVSDEILRQVSDAYRKIRNTIRYMLSNLSDYDPSIHKVDSADLPELDRWALARYEELKRKVITSYDKYEFHSIYHGLNYFCGTTMSAFYLDIIKDRLYTAGTDSQLRRSAQTVLYEILDGILRLMAPVLSFTACEAWESLHDHDQSTPLTESVFFADFPPVSPVPVDSSLDARWNKLIKIRSEITRALEIARREKVIGHPLEAELLLSAEDDLADFVKVEWQTIKEISIVSEMSELQVDAVPTEQVIVSEELPGLKIAVRAATGEKCERCWTRSTTVGANSNHPQICDRCAAVVVEMDLPSEG